MKNISVKIAVLLVAMLCITMLAACSTNTSSNNSGNSNQNNSNVAGDSVNGITDADFKIETASFDEIVAAAKGTKVNFYGWGGDEYRNRWLSQDIAPILKDKYDITFEYVPMDIDQILNKLSGERQANNTIGSIDMVWINGENFFTAKENNFLFGPFLEKLPAYDAYIDIDDEETLFDFGYPIQGYEAPYGKAQIVLLGDGARTPEMPANTDEFFDYVKKYPGQVTYPALPDFTGSAFVRNIIYELTGYEQYMDMAADKEVVRAAIAPALDYLRSLNPYLWNGGKTFPATSTEQENMFADGEVVFFMSYSPYSVETRINDGVYPETVRAYLFDKGTIGNTSYMAIPNNAPNKAGAMVAIDYIMSAAGQLSQYEKLKTIPVVDNAKLSAEERQAFEAIEIGKGALTQDELLSKRLPEMPAALVPIIEEIWLEEVVGK